MKNLFEIDTNEIKRILSLHEESTKKQYLNVLSEGAQGLNWELDRLHNFYSPNGDTGQIDSKNIVTVDRTNNKLNIGNKFKFSCKPSKNSTDKNDNAPYYYTSYDGKRLFRGENSSLTKVLLKRYCNGTTLKSDGEILGNKNLKDPKVNDPKKTETTDQTARAKKCGYSSWSEYKKGKNGKPWYCPNLNKIDGSQVVALTPQQMTDTTKEIQQTVGIQNPTGQFTDADIDLLITKLS